MKRIITASIGLAAALQMAAQGLNYNASKSNTGNLVIEAVQPGVLERYSTGGTLLGTVATVGNGVAVTKSSGNYIVATGSSLVQVSPTGVVTTIANAPSGTAGTARWVAVAPDQQGNIVAVDNSLHAVWLITPAGPGTAGAVNKVASYTVANATQAEDAAVAVDGSGNYLVLEDNGGAVHLFSITPGGTVNPVQLSGATATQCHTSLVPYAGGYLFVSPADNAVFEVEPTSIEFPNLTAVIAEVASNVSDAGTPTSVAADADSGNLYVTTSTGPIVEIAVKSAGNGVCAPNCLTYEVADVPTAFDIIAETYADLPHLAAGNVWTTGFYIMNTGFLPASYSVSFFDDLGNPVALPLPSGSSAVLTGTLPAQGMTYIEAGNPLSALGVAQGLVSADPTITVQALFRQSTGGGNYYEAGVPASLGGSGFAVPFDDTTFAPTGAQLYTGFAIANLDPTNPATVTCVAMDQTGAVIPGALTIPTMAAMGHYANYLFPALTGKRGTINCSSNTRIAGLALRFLGAAFSSLPVLY